MSVDRRLNLGGTLICERALASGDIDVYVEYTGTALTAVFHQPLAGDSSAVLQTVRDSYARTGRALLQPLGFNNTFTILVRGSDARQLKVRTIDDAAMHASSGGLVSAMNSWNGPMDSPGCRRNTGCASPSRRG